MDVHREAVLKRKLHRNRAPQNEASQVCIDVNQGHYEQRINEFC